MIFNRKELQGEKKIIVSLPNKQVGLQFALFAVPNPKSRVITPEFSEIVDPVFLHVIDLLDRIGKRLRRAVLTERQQVRKRLDDAMLKLASKPGGGRSATR